MKTLDIYCDACSRDDMGTVVSPCSFCTKLDERAYIALALAQYCADGGAIELCEPGKPPWYAGTSFEALLPDLRTLNIILD